MSKKKRVGVATSDWHIMAKPPRKRREGFIAEQYDKIEEINHYTRDIALEHPEWEVYLLNAGDLHDKARIPRWLSSHYISMLTSPLFTSTFTHIACAGQHDQIYHSTKLDDTSLQALYAAGCVQRYGRGIKTADWGVRDGFDDVLVTHICCTERVNEFIEYSVTPKQLLRQRKARVIITGDYHVAHYYKEGGRLVVNPGSIMRLSSDEIDRKPSIYLVDLDEAEVLDQVFLDVKPAGEVFDLSRIDEDKEEKKQKQERDKRFEKYIDKIKEKSVRPDFDVMLEKVIKLRKPSDAVKQEIDEAMNGHSN